MVWNMTFAFITTHNWLTAIQLAHSECEKLTQAFCLAYDRHPYIERHTCMPPHTPTHIFNANIIGFNHMPYLNFKWNT